MERKGILVAVKPPLLCQDDLLSMLMTDTHKVLFLGSFCFWKRGIHFMFCKTAQPAKNIKFKIMIITALVINVPSE